MSAGAIIEVGKMQVMSSCRKAFAGHSALLCIVALLGLFVMASEGRAQGTNIGRPWLFGEGIACDASLLPWHSVWFGHFSGGDAYYRKGAPSILLGWEDRKLCFPSRRQCMAWQRGERRFFHRLEGYWTCLRIR